MVELFPQFVKIFAYVQRFYAQNKVQAERTETFVSRLPGEKVPPAALHARADAQGDDGAFVFLFAAGLVQKDALFIAHRLKEGKQDLVVGGARHIVVLEAERGGAVWQFVQKESAGFSQRAASEKNSSAARRGARSGEGGRE